MGMRKGVGWVVAVLFVVAVSQQGAAATVLTFGGIGLSNDDSIPQSYGDAAPSTPHVQVSYADQDGNDLYYWDSGYNSLLEVAWNKPGDDTSSNLWYEIALSADPGYVVRLEGFDLGNWYSGTLLVDRVALLDAGGNVLTNPNTAQAAEWLDVQIAGTAGPHTAFSFATPVVSPTIRIRIDTGDTQTLSENIGIDNVAFSEALVPEPGMSGLGALLVLAAAAFGLRRGR